VDRTAALSTELRGRRGPGYLGVCERAALPGRVGRAALGPQQL